MATFDRVSAGLVAALAGAAFATAAAATPAAPAPDDHGNCFASNSWEGWTAPGNGDVLYLRVRMNEYYRVELTPGTHVHKDPGYFLISHVRGSNWICSALDLNLSLSDTHGFRRPLIAVSMRKLTPQEVAAIPRKDLP